MKTALLFLFACTLSFSQITRSGGGRPKACVGSPGNTNGIVGELCHNAGVVYSCAQSGGCSLASHWRKQVSEDASGNVTTGGTFYGGAGATCPTGAPAGSLCLTGDVYINGLLTVSGTPTFGLVSYHLFGLTNLIAKPDAFSDTTVWARSGVQAFGSGSVANAAANPVDGEVTADKIVETATSAQHSVYGNSLNLHVGAYVVGASYTASVYAKAAERNYVAIVLWGPRDKRAVFDLANGTVVGTARTTGALPTASIESVGNGWYRCHMMFTAESGDNNVAVNIMNAANTTLSYLGDGASGIYVWGASVTRSATALAFTTPVYADATLQSWSDISGNGNSVVLGAANTTITNDPRATGVGLIFDGTDDQITGLPEKGATWTLIYATDTGTLAVDSAGGSYINGISQVGATEPDLGTAGGYSGTVAARVQYSRILTAAEHKQAHLSIRTRVNVYSATVPVAELLNPYVPKANSYKVAVHMHTTNSDGGSAPAEVAQTYNGLGYDAIAITDHDVLTPDPGVSSIMTIPGVEESVGKHVVQIGVNAANLNGTDQEIITQAATHGSVVWLAHPNHPTDGATWSDADIVAVDGYDGIEIYNAAITNKNAENRWDYLLTDRRRAWGFAADDMHDIGTAGGSALYVYADTLSVAALVASMKAGNFYSSTGATISSIALAGRTITVTTGAAATIAFIGSGGSVLHSVAGATTASYTATTTEVYVRVRVTRDSDGKQAWTNPFYVV
jgi:hypothetical protein